NASSTGEHETAMELVKDLNLENNVRFITDFLEVSQIEILMQLSDINILAYKDAGESSSDAVSKCLASGSPTVVTNIKQFGEFDEEVLKIENEHPETVASGIKDLLNNPE